MVPMNAAKAVTATFSKSRSLTIAKTGNGSGTVRAPPGIDCGSDCSEPYLPNAIVDLEADAAPGSTFTQWLGACDGSTEPTCSVTLSPHSTITLTAAAGPGHVFGSWSGACSGSAATCAVVME